MPTLDIRFFGECRFIYDGEPVTGLQTKRMRTLLGYLILHAGQQIAATHLAFLFWPDSTEKQARTNLRRAFYNVRQVFPPIEEFLDRGDHTVCWRTDGAYTLDVAAFEADIAQARAQMDVHAPDAARATLAAAVARYQGDVLPDCYDDWIAAPRERLRQECLYALEQLTQLHAEAGDYAAAIRYGEILLRKDALRERSYHTLMQLYLQDGDRPAALRVYHACASELARELGVEPAAELTEIYNRLLAGDDTATQSFTAPPKALAPLEPEREDLVGRKAERQTLMAAWRRAAAGRGGVVLIRGEAGMGKTRLAEELYRWVNQLGIAAAHTRAYDGASALAYAPIVDWLRAPALATRIDGLDTARLAELARLAPEVCPSSATLPPLQPLAENWQRTRLFEALAHTVTRSEQPLLLWLDDLQWCDHESLAWLQYLLQYAPSAPLLLLATVRDDELEATHPLHQWEQIVRRTDQLTEIALAPLSRAESMELGRMAGHGRLSHAELTRQSRMAGGNPLFMVEMARAAAEVAADAPTAPADTGLATTPATEDDEHAVFLPSKVYDVIQARLAKLSAPAQAMVDLAATVGRSFSFELLMHAGAMDESRMVQALDELWRRRIIKENDAGARGDVYDFSHDRIRDVAYDRLSSVRRRYNHRTLAAALTTLHAAHLDAVSAQVARHHEQAGNHREAVRFYRMAGAWAAAHFAHADTIRYVSRALDLSEDDDHAGRFDLHARREEAYLMQAARADQARELDAMTALADALDAPDKRITVLLRRAALAEIQGKYADAIAWMDRIDWDDAPAQDVTDTTAAHQAERRRQQEIAAAVRLGSIYWNQGDYPRAETVYRRGLARAEQAGDRVHAATILLHLGALNAYHGPYAEALRISRAALDAAHVVGNEEGQIWARNQLGYVIVEQGDDDYGAAEEALKDGLALARQTGNRTYIAKLSSNLAMLYDRRGEHDRGLACLDEALAIAQETGSARHQAFALNYRGNLLLNRGDYAGAGDALEQALTLFHAIGYRQGEGKTLSELALLTLILGEPDAARAHAAAARTIAAELGLRRDVAVAYTRTGYIAEHQRAWQAAAEMYAQARHVYAATGQRRRALEPTAGMARIAWATGAHDVAVRMATEIRDAFAARPPDATCEAQWVALTCAQILPANEASTDLQSDFATSRDAFCNAFETPPILS